MFSFAPLVETVSELEGKPVNKNVAQFYNKVNLLVYICKGGAAYAYHMDKACEGLTYCTRDIIAVTKSDAKAKFKRKPCKRCSK
ncbi:hypothetical protein GCM10011323_23070 [Pontibacter amylolyticus]|uniref:Cupin-like domain-containing protein n=2 Tax=Pontibacter amylolyticus TaxID=1424080 RepID=A0ABQ1W840_9BACT|nr:hypothetical protein GCM10011323_23070 [Pontibacter amylolyticus]